VSLWESGAYIDSSIRYAYMTNDNASLDSEGRRVTWDAHAHALSASIEIGRKLSLSPVWFFEPHVKATAGRLWFDDDQTNTDVSVIFDDMTSFLGRAGFTLGADFSKTFQLAVRASVIKEFEGEPLSRREHRCASKKISLTMPGDSSGLTSRINGLITSDSLRMFYMRRVRET
jgi:outer membrane autotransporter protein